MKNIIRILNDIRNTNKVLIKYYDYNFINYKRLCEFCDDFLHKLTKIFDENKETDIDLYNYESHLNDLNGKYMNIEYPVLDYNISKDYNKIEFKISRFKDNPNLWKILVNRLKIMDEPNVSLLIQNYFNEKLIKYHKENELNDIAFVEVFYKCNPNDDKDIKFSLIIHLK